MELKKGHIQRLYDFTKQHKVEHFDLQTELVDHLANDIEQIWKKEPNLTFEQARYKATIKFGIYGFSKFVQQREKAIKNENWRLFKQYFITYFKLPKIIMTMFLVALVYLGFQFVQNKTFMFFTGLLVVTLVAFIYAVFLNMKYKRRRKKTNKKWLFEDILSNRIFLFFMIMIVIQPNYHDLLQDDTTVQWSFIMQLLSSILIVLMAMVFYISLYIIPPKFEATIKKYKIA
ncbi:hypothetical protein UMM65_04505 [Aureibaculum sp. 2210JD6-5]|uniref:hypothetical protein n=1 Tax=Aureibaculum sp. 2210JD6-5 TaxID=3103957 RepID=UPI002AACFAD5|nr:hypothetical protein [Aureibaculum sp. 2210JD6-5]MDY7394491.1 hypothetical protein [Aureibaculum sp. 2210JD6-5]